MGEVSQSGHGNSGDKIQWLSAFANQSGFPGLFFGTFTFKATYSTFWPLNPPCLAIQRPINGTPVAASYSIAGVVRNAYHINTRDFDPGQVLTIGSDDYLVFPHGRKSDDADSALAPNAFRLGIAVNRDL